MKNIFPLFLSGIVTFAGYVIAHPLVFGICRELYNFGGKVGCSDASIELLGEPLYVFGMSAMVPSLLLVFTRQGTSLWYRFTMLWVPLSIVFIALTPSTSGTWMPIYFVSKSTMVLVMSGLFLIVSLILIAWKSSNKKLTKN